MPSPLSNSLLRKAEAVFEQANALKRCIPLAQLPGRVAQARVLNSYYSCLIEGIDSELPTLRPSTAWERNGKPLTHAEAHIRAQSHFEKLEVFSHGGERTLGGVFSPLVVESLHEHLFESVNPADLLLNDGRAFVPGQLRSVSQRQVVVGKHEAPCWSIVDAMLKRMHQGYGVHRLPTQALLACLAFHHRFAHVHPFDDGNGRTGRLLLHLQLQRLGLEPSLWSISKTLYERREGYYRALANADQPRRGDLDGRGQLSQSGLVGFIDFMLASLLVSIA